MIVRCHKAVIRPTGNPLRIYFGDKGREYLIHDVQMVDPEFDCPEVAGLFITVGHFCMLWLEDPEDTISLAHECLHAATYVWERAGAALHIHHNDEVTAYTQGHIMELVYQALEKHYEL